VKSPVISPSQSRAPVLPKDKDPQLVEIESILSDGLDQAYISLTLDKRQQFRTEGEILARTIQSMIQSGKANSKWNQII
jgi:hypothetical protein